MGEQRTKYTENGDQILFEGRSLFTNGDCKYRDYKTLLHSYPLSSDRAEGGGGGVT